MSSILFDKKDQFATIFLNRPEKFNSFNREMAIGLQEKLDECEGDSQVRAILISAKGKAFSAGQDLNEVVDKDNGIEMENILSEHYNPLIRRLRIIEKPIVCAVNGVAAGAGANIALACDIVLAAESASFIQAFSKIGLIPDSGGTWMLPRLIGLQRATALTMLGDKVTAKEAVEMGMIWKSLPDDELMNFADKMVRKLSTMPTKGLGLTKRALNHGLHNSLDSQLDYELRLQSEAGTTYDFNEGIEAFLQKRKPNFKGK